MPKPKRVEFWGKTYKSVVTGSGATVCHWQDCSTIESTTSLYHNKIYLIKRDVFYKIIIRNVLVHCYGSEKYEP